MDEERRKKFDCKTVDTVYPITLCSHMTKSLSTYVFTCKKKLFNHLYVKSLYCLTLYILLLYKV